MSYVYDQTPGALAGILARLHTQAMQARMSPHRCTSAQYPVLQYLWEKDGQTQSALCKKLRVEQPTLANTLNRMVRDGLVRKVKDTNDRRQTILKLTKRARDLKDALNQSASEVNSTAVLGLPPEQLDLFLDLVRHMIGNLEQDLGQAPVILDQEITPVPAEAIEPKQEAPAPMSQPAKPSPASQPAPLLLGEDILVLDHDLEVS